MKRKILLIVVFFAVLMLVLFLPKENLAKNIDTPYCSYYIKNGYEENDDYETENSIYRIYSGVEGEYGSSVIISTYPNNGLEPYTKSNMTENVEYYKTYFAQFTDLKLLENKGQMVTLNGVKGYKIEYSIKYDYSDMLFGEIEYHLRSDNYTYQIVINSSKKFVNSSEAKKIINSFKIKDTVKKTNNGIPFTDVPSNSWYASAVKYAYTNKIISGYNDYTFAPSDKVTRGMFVTILYNMSGKPAIKSKASKFKDVKDSKKWYYKAVLWASENGIVSGYDNGNFGPNDNITREQLAVMLYKYARYKGKDVSKQGNITTFGDYKKVSSWATKQVKWAVGTGVITGSNGNLNPKGNATRAETASMIYKYCTKVGK